MIAIDLLDARLIIAEVQLHRIIYRIVPYEKADQPNDWLFVISNFSVIDSCAI